MRVRQSSLLARVLVALVALLAAGDAWATAQFSRKYQIGCQTCHSVVPQLNSNGEAFRRLGFRFANTKDEDITKEAMTEIGSEGSKRAYPKVVWPTAIPTIPPIAFSLGHIFRHERDVPTQVSRAGKDELSFASTGTFGEVQLAGTLDETYAYFAQWNFGYGSFGDGPFGAARSYAMINDVFGNDLGLNVRFGQFEPGLLEFSNWTKLTESGSGVVNNRLDFARIVGDNTFTIEPTQQGVEFFGFIDENTYWDLGIVEGRVALPNVQNNQKDIYFRVDHKFLERGKLGYNLDGTAPTTAPMTSGPGHNIWGDAHALTVGAFIYDGSTTLDAVTRQNDDFLFYGSSAVYSRDRFHAELAFTRRDHDRPDIGRAFDRQANVWSVQGDYAFFPWLVASARHEDFDVTERPGDASTRDWRRNVLALNYLPRANINVTLGSDLVDRSYEGGGYELDNVTLAFFVGF